MPLRSGKYEKPKIKDISLKELLKISAEASVPDPIPEIPTGSGRQTCPYCGGNIEFHVNSKKIYHGADYGPVYVCQHYPSCDAYVGCHKGSTAPLGSVARGALRNMRKKGHELFSQVQALNDKLINDNSRINARKLTYAWLAEELKIPVKDCHFGEFRETGCEKAINIMVQFLKEND